jgi:uncharacterized Fe-S cluster-containing radical SAM superfamily protein
MTEFGHKCNADCAICQDYLRRAEALIREGMEQLLGEVERMVEVWKLKDDILTALSSLRPESPEHD